MIKNLNDLLSVIVLLAMTINCFRILIWSYIKKGDNNQDEISKWQLIKDYIDNEEE